MELTSKLTILSLALLGLAISREYGYFLYFDTDLIQYISVNDYLGNVINWFPAFIFFLGFGYILGRFTEGTRRRISATNSLTTFTKNTFILAKVTSFHLRAIPYLIALLFFLQIMGGLFSARLEPFLYLGLGPIIVFLFGYVAYEFEIPKMLMPKFGVFLANTTVPYITIFFLTFWFGIIEASIDYKKTTGDVVVNHFPNEKVVFMRRLSSGTFVRRITDNSIYFLFSNSKEYHQYPLPPISPESLVCRKLNIFCMSNKVTTP